MFELMPGWNDFTKPLCCETARQILLWGGRTYGWKKMGVQMGGLNRGHLHQVAHGYISPLGDLDIIQQWFASKVRKMV